MANKDYYNILGIDKNASEADIKKAYRKKAMEWHPDKHKGDKKAEAEFKKINEAYANLKDPKKRQTYDNFGSAGANFGGGGQGFGGFEDLFSNASRGNSGYSSQNFDFSDLFGDMMGGARSKKTNANPFSGEKTYSQIKKEPQKLDVEKTYEVPIFDLLLGTKLNIETVYGENLKLKIPEGTKPGTKFKIKEKGRKSEGRTGDMFVIVDAKMPKSIPDDVKILLESIKYRF